MQPRFAALLFVLGLADLAYVNLGLGHEVFGDGASGASPPDTDKPAPSPAPGVIQATRAPIPPSSPAPREAAPTEPPPSEPPVAAPSAESPAPTSPSTPTETPSPVPAAAPAPAPEALALPAPTPPSEPQREAAPPAVAPPPQRLDDTPRTEPAPPGGDLASAPRPAQAGLGTAVARADLAPARDSATAATAATAAEASAPIESAASLPDAELTVAFPDTASAWLTEPAYAQLMALAAQLRAHPDYRIHIVGHADARGSREFNLDLGGRRARVVTELLARAGVPRRQLEMESRGEDEPRKVGDSEEVWAANRRVEISIGTERSTSP